MSAAPGRTDTAKPSNGRLSLRMGLVLLVLATLTPMLVFSGWAIVRMAETQSDSIERGGQHLAQSLAVALDRELTSMVSALQVLSTSPYLKDGNLAAFHGQALEVLNHKTIRREGVHILLSDPNGQQILNTRRPYGAPQPAARTTVVRRTAESGEIQVSELFVGSSTGRPMAAVSVPILQAGRMSRVVSMTVPADVFRAMLEQQGLPLGWVAGLWDRKGIYIARTGSPQNIKEQNPTGQGFTGTPVDAELERRAALSPSGTLSNVARDGTPLFTAFARSSVSGWTVAVGVPQAILSRPMHQSLVLLLTGGGTLLLLSVVLALLVGRRIAQPVVMLARSATALANPATLPSSPATGGPIWIREVDAVQDALIDAARRLRDSLALQRLSIEAAGIGLWSFDTATGRIRTRGKIGELLAVPEETAVALETWLRNVAAEHRASVRAALQAGQPHGTEFDREFPVVQPDGQVRWLAMRGAFLADFLATPLPSPLPGPGRAIGILEDVTERRRAHEERVGELVERHATDLRLFAAIIENMHDMVVALDQEERFILFNSAYGRQFEALFGRRLRIGQTFTEALSHRPDMLAHDREMWRRALSGERFSIMHDIEGEDGWHGRFEIAFEPILDSVGRQHGAFQLARDVSERERTATALRQTEETLRQSQKMEAIGQLTGGIAHDFNNLLQAIGAALYLIEQRAGDGPVKAPVTMATQAVQRGATLTQHLLTFSRKQRLEPKPVRVDALVRSMGGLLERTLGGTILIRTEAEPGLWPALVDPNQLEMAILNLAINARDAMPDGGGLNIVTGNAPCGSPGRPADLRPGDYVRIAVADTGTGMSEEVADRAFEPFFTTKGVGRGTGLGLSTVHGLAAQSGGTVTLETAPGTGTTITLYLPRAAVAEEDGRDPGGPMAEKADRRGATILLVEDEALVRLATATVLVQNGFRVIEAAGGAEALDALARDASVDLVITDYAMPGMTGLELVRTLREERPAMPVLLVTGYAEMSRSSPDADGVPILQKPYRTDELTVRIHAALKPAAAGPPMLEAPAGAGQD